MSELIDHLLKMVSFPRCSSQRRVFIDTGSIDNQYVSRSQQRELYISILKVTPYQKECLIVYSQLDPLLCFHFPEKDERSDDGPAMSGQIKVARAPRAPQTGGTTTKMAEHEHPSMNIPASHNAQPASSPAWLSSRPPNLQYPYSPL